MEDKKFILEKIDESLQSLEEYKNDWENKIEEFHSKYFKKKKDEKKELLKQILIYCGGINKLDIDKFYPPLFKDKNIILPLPGKSYLLTINLDQELNIDEYNYNRNKYYLKFQKIGEYKHIIQAGYRFISLQGKEFTLEQYYEQNIDKIKKGIEKSKDLLDQILFIYALKRAQNGDQDAYKKIFNIYEEFAIESIKKWTRKFNLYEDISQIQDEAINILNLIILGDDIWKLNEILKNKKGEINRNSIILNRSIEKIIINKFFEFPDYIKKKIKKYKKLKKQYEKDEINFDNVKNIFIGSANIKDLGHSPKEWLLDDINFNKEILNKKNYLNYDQWIRHIFRKRLIDFLRQWKRLYNNEKEIKTKNKEELDYIIDKSKSEEEFNNQINTLEIDDLDWGFFKNREIKKCKTQKQKKVKERNLNIYSDSLNGFTLNEIIKEYKISKRTFFNIVKKIEKKLSDFYKE